MPYCTLCIQVYLIHLFYVTCHIYDGPEWIGYSPFCARMPPAGPFPCTEKQINLKKKNYKKIVHCPKNKETITLKNRNVI